MNEHQLSRVADFITALEKASKDTGIRAHAHGSPMVLEDTRNRGFAPFDLNADFSDSTSNYVIEKTS